MVRILIRTIHLFVETMIMTLAMTVQAESARAVRARASLRGGIPMITLLAQRFDYLRRRLDQFDQHALAADRELVAGAGMDETDVVAGAAAANPAGGEAHASRFERRTVGSSRQEGRNDIVESVSQPESR